MNKEKILYKIISGRTKVNLDGLVLYILEANPSLINESYEIYEEVYDRAYMDGLYIDEELKNLLIEQDIWAPSEEKLIDEIKKQIDNKKVEAFENYFRARELSNIKYSIKLLNNKLFSLLGRKSTFANLTCHYVAETARKNWVLLKTTYLNKKLIKDHDFNIDNLNRVYLNNSIDNVQIRSIAHYDIWRTIWNTNKIHGGKLFNKNPTNFTRDQLFLCSYTSMYDNVYEHPESPNDKVIEDDDCLDGWFIFQKRKNEKEKNSKNVDDVIKNSKIKNSKEIFIIANNTEEAEAIHNLNDQQSKNIIKQREKTILEKGIVKDTDFSDVQIDLMSKSHQMAVDKMRNK